MKMKSVKKADIIAGLQSDILRLQGAQASGNITLDLGLGPIKDAFPNASFPLGAVHEFISKQAEDSVATSGFVLGLLSALMGKIGTTLWISSSCTLFPPAIASFCPEPERFIFINLPKQKDVLWTMEEALKCGAISAVVGELHELDFTASRRLQLAVEQSHVTGFVLRNNFRKLTTTACVSRWKITQLPGEVPDGLPGLGFPKWRIELLRVRNGKPGVWDMIWMDRKFVPLSDSSADKITAMRLQASVYQDQQKKAG